MLGWAGGLLAAAQLVAGAAPAQLDTIVVTGNPAGEPAAALPYSVGTVGADVIEDAGPGISLGEALARVPGIAAASRNNYAQDTQLSSRGYGARAGFGVRGLRLYEDGIPATAPDGQGQVTQFDLADADRIEVLRGPFSALYGNASGGVIALFRRDVAKDALLAGVDVGSFGLQQYRLGGEALLGQAWNGRAEGTYLAIDGFRPHSAAARQLYALRLGRTDDEGKLVLDASHWDQPAEDPLGLTRAQFEVDPYTTAPQAIQFNTRKDAQQSQVGVSWHDGGLAIGYYGGIRSVTQWLAIPIAAQANANHSGGVVDFDRRYTGVDARYTWRWTDLDLTGGIAGDLQDEDRRGYENFTGPGPACTSAGTQCGVTGALRRDENNRVDDFDQYLQAQWRFAQRWSSMLGVRHGQVHFRSQDHYLSNGDDSGERRYDYTTPVAGLVFEPAAGWSVRASAGAAYETPTFNELAYRPDGTTGMNQSLQAQTSRQAELGGRWHGDAATFDLALFGARTDDELVVVTNAGGRSSFGNAGRTNRHGAELGANWRIADAFSSTAALSWLSATYRDDFLTCGPPPCTTPALPVPAGNRIPGVPTVSSFLDFAWQPAPFEAAVEWRARSDVAVNDTNSDFAPGYGLLALRGAVELPLRRARLRLGVRLDNLLDRAYAGSVIVNEANARYFEPGAPRSVLLSLRLEPAD